jgi:solute carrier family 35 protein F5
LGVCLLLIVVALWVGSSELIQAIFKDLSFNEPFFLTYFSTSLFTLFLVIVGLQRLFAKLNRSLMPAERVDGSLHHDSSDESSEVKTDDHERKEQDSSSGEIVHEIFSLRETAILSLTLCPIWFAMNYLFNLSLTLTSVASTTILSSTSGIWVMVFSSVLLRSRFAWPNIAGVMCCIVGAVIISLKDQSSSSSSSSSSDQKRTISGDVASVLSAIFYGLYTVVLRWRVSDESRLDMRLMLGLLGFFNMTLLWPLFFILDYSNVEAFRVPPLKVIGALFLNGLLGTVLSDYLWSLSVLLTSPLIATIGLSLTIPLAVVADAILRSADFGWAYLLGSAAVLVGFVMVNWEHKKTEHGAEAGGEERASEEDRSRSGSASSVSIIESVGIIEREGGN